MQADRIHQEAQRIRRAILCDRRFRALSRALDRAANPTLYESTLLALGERHDEVLTEQLQSIPSDLTPCDVMTRVTILESLLGSMSIT